MALLPTLVEPPGLAADVPLKPTKITSLSGAFQEYTLLDETYVTPIPDKIPYEDAVVTPTGLSTATVGLFHDEYLSLEL
ncbi:zinc-binding oxidoreductase [Penicillium argentinense]|uniref:Zinc-binding oxidoreductase n=1 Tax=Penicillium argentinense TaxID=1131581 RepID=A0A9W9EYY6_9EURO|nr:zinc-binding oxidoreductase [Penicillium argentinense]KAJ5090485.1 zinc-binding oxidoreductase [Penicillium argentinense]